MEIESSSEEGDFSKQQKGSSKGRGKKTTKATASKASAKNDATTEETGSSGKRQSLAVEQKYQKMTQREHIIKRPDTYSRYGHVIFIFSW